MVLLWVKGVTGLAVASDRDGPLVVARIAGDEAQGHGDHLNAVLLAKGGLADLGQRRGDGDGVGGALTVLKNKRYLGAHAGHLDPVLGGHAGVAERDAARGRDRKSTRLNS